MLIVAIHGFLPLTGRKSWLSVFQRFSREKTWPDIWLCTQHLVSELEKNNGIKDVEFMRLGYKDIIYDDRRRFFWPIRRIQQGGPSHISAIRKYLVKNKMMIGGENENEPIVILGHSLGAWAAILLAKALICGDDEPGQFEDVDSAPDRQEVPKFKIKILTLVDALQLTKDSPAYNRQWILQPEDKPICTVNRLLNFVQNLVDPIKDKQIIRGCLLEGVVKLKFQDSEVTYHRNYFGRSEIWDISNAIVHTATRQQVGEIPVLDQDRQQNVVNFPLSETHGNIDECPQIFNDIHELVSSLSPTNDRGT